MRDAWRAGGSSSHRPSYGDAQVTGVSRRGIPFSMIFGLLILAGLGYAAWKYGPALAAKFHITTDAENAAEHFHAGISSTMRSENALKEAVLHGNSGALSVHAARKTRWWVAFGPTGASEEKPRMVRDDGYPADANAFFLGVLADPGPGAAPAGFKPGPKPSLLRASWTDVKLAEDSRPWRVVVGWSENASQ
jgi:hypothetical protein